ncbi:putative reverse transcriptase domain-containing protein [Tanacetum coccineum]
MADIILHHRYLFIDHLLGPPQRSDAFLDVRGLLRIETTQRQLERLVQISGLVKSECNFWLGRLEFKTREPKDFDHVEYPREIRLIVYSFAQGTLQEEFRHSDCPKLKDQNRGNKVGNKNGVGEARGKVYVLGGGDANPDSNVVKDIDIPRQYLYSQTDQVSSFSSYTRRFQVVKLARNYIDEIIARNGILHPQADGQGERMSQTLEDIMRACVIDFGSSYHLSIRCAPFEALYGRKLLIKEKLKAARDHQKSYADNGRKPLEFEVGDRVLLKVSPWKCVIRFGKRGKLAPMYVGPFEILERIGLVAYRLRLPEELSSVHDIFHVSNLKKCLADANLYVPLNEIKIDKTLRFVEEPVEVMDREIRNLKRSKIITCESSLEFKAWSRVHLGTRRLYEVKVSSVIC